MSKGCTLLVWAKPPLAVFTAEVMAAKFQPGDVVDVQPGVFHFGGDIEKLGWWRVIYCKDRDAKHAAVLMTDEKSGRKLRRLRVRRLDLANLGDEATFAEIMAAAFDVPETEDKAAEHGN